MEFEGISDTQEQGCQNEKWKMPKRKNPALSNKIPVTY
jgi:hypothetical protein